MAPGGTEWLPNSTMKRRLKSLASVVCLALAVTAFVLSRYEPEPGPGSWLTEFAGDWTVRVDDTDWFIGNAVFEGGGVALYGLTAQGIPDCAHPIATNVLAYAGDGRGVLLEAKDGYGWFAGHSGAMVTSPDVEGLPAPAASLQGFLRKPAASFRTRLAVLAIVCAVGSLGFVVAAWVRKV